ncbi:hypothetical protein FG620_023720, partial [Salmonella enterica subsp. enterica serovar Anatum]
RLYETRKPKTIHVVAQVADVLQQQSLHVRSRIGDSFCYPVRHPRQPSRVLNDRSTIMRTRGQDPTLPEMRRVRLLEMADA